MSGSTTLRWGEPTNGLLVDLMKEVDDLQWSDAHEKLKPSSTPIDAGVEALLLAVGFKKKHIDLEVVSRGPSFLAERGLRTVCRMIARSGTAVHQLVSAGTANLSREQRDYAFTRGWVSVESEGRHAEINLLRYCANRNLSPQMLITNNNTCPNCIPVLTGVRGNPHPTDPRHTWYWNAPVDLTSYRTLLI